jgi:hypothetical protein
LEKVEAASPFVALLQAEEYRVDVHRVAGGRDWRGMKVSILTRRFAGVESVTVKPDDGSSARRKGTVWQA